MLIVNSAYISSVQIIDDNITYLGPLTVFYTAENSAIIAYGGYRIVINIYNAQYSIRVFEPDPVTAQVEINEDRTALYYAGSKCCLLPAGYAFHTLPPDMFYTILYMRRDMQLDGKEKSITMYGNYNIHIN